MSVCLTWSVPHLHDFDWPGVSDWTIPIPFIHQVNTTHPFVPASMKPCLPPEPEFMMYLFVKKYIHLSSSNSVSLPYGAFFDLQACWLLLNLSAVLCVYFYDETFLISYMVVIYVLVLSPPPVRF